jgi:hypothetical protein
MNDLLSRDGVDIIDAVANSSSSLDNNITSMDIQPSEAINRKRGRSLDRPTMVSDLLSQTDKPKRSKKNVFENICVSCVLPCDANSFVTCTTCKTVAHLKCLGYTRATLPNINELASIFSFSCVLCRERARSNLCELSSKLTALHSEIKALYDLIAAPRSNDSLNVPQTVTVRNELVWPGNSRVNESTQMTTHHVAPAQSHDRESVAHMVRKTLTEEKRRSHNVLFAGVSETNSDITTNSVNNRQDIDMIIDLCQQNLDVDIRDKVKLTKRLGKISTSSKPRRLLVCLDSESMATEILRNARRLRFSNDSHVAANVYVNRDLSQEEERAAFERRQRRRETVRPTGTIDQNGIPNSASGQSTATVHTREAGRVFWRSSTRRVSVGQASTPTEGQTIAATRISNQEVHAPDLSNAQSFPSLPIPGLSSVVGQISTIITPRSTGCDGRPITAGNL